MPRGLLDREHVRIDPMIGEYVLRKLACPDGRLAGLFSRLLNVSNASLNAAVLRSVPDRGDQAILDIGFGGGVAIALALADARIARVAGVDPSEAMVRASQARYRRPSTVKPVDVRRGAAERLPWGDGAFDAVISVNSLYYWIDMRAAFGEIKRVLRPGGVFVLGLRAKEEMDRVGLENHGYRSPSSREVSDALVAAGFLSLTVEERIGSRRGGEVVIRAVVS